MKIKLKALNNVTVQNGHFKQSEIKKDDIIEGDFSKFGVSLLLDNVWSLYISYNRIEDNFKVYGQ